MRTPIRSTMTVAGAATGDLAASFNSDPSFVGRMTSVTIEADVSGSGSLNGTLKLQGSNDLGSDPYYGLNAVTGLTHWVDIAGPTAITADGGNAFSVADVAFRWFRVAYTRTGGTGTLALTLSAKAVG